MPSLQVGQTAIAYTVRYSDRAKRQRIIVTPGRVEVVVPTNTPASTITKFVRHHQQWLLDTVNRVAALPRATPERYATGEKILYRGRYLAIAVEDADIEAVNITCKNRLYIQVPRTLPEDARQSVITDAVQAWMRDRALRDAQRFVEHFAQKLSVQPRDVKISQQKYAWGTCGRSGIIRINWRLVQAPVAVLEYVAAHEVVHLLHRHHQASFWATLATVLPDWRERKELLKAWERENPLF